MPLKLVSQHVPIVENHLDVCPEHKKARGRPKTCESYDMKSYARKFREHATPFVCELCKETMSYFSKTRHLKSAKHIAKSPS